MKKDHLHTLVQTLSPREKANFIRFASSNKSNSNAIRLFRLLCRMDEYDETALRKKLGKSADSVNFAVTKSYLYELLLKALRNYGLEHSVDQQIYHGLGNIQLLMGRLLFEDAEKQLVKVKRLAEKYELLDFQDTILGIEIQIMVFTKRPSEMHECLNKLRAEQDIVREKLRYFQKCNDLLTRLYLLRIQYSDAGRLGTEELERELEALDISFLDDDPPYHCFRLDAMRYYDLYYIHEMRIRPELVMMYQEKLLDLYRASPHQIEMEHRPYSMTVFSYCYFALEKGRRDSVLEHMKMLKEFSEGSGPDFPRRRIRKIYYNLMLRYISLYEKSLIPDTLEKEMLRFIRDKKNLEQDNPKPEAQILGNLVKIKILRGDFDKSLEYANIVLNAMADRIPKRVLNDVYMMNLVAHYELGNYEYLGSLIRSLSRRISKEYTIPQSMTLVLQAIGQLLNCEDSESTRHVFLRLRENLYGLSGEIPGLWSQGRFVYVWAEHKLSGIAMYEIYEMMYRKKTSLPSAHEYISPEKIDMNPYTAHGTIKPIQTSYRKEKAPSGTWPAGAD